MVQTHNPYEAPAADLGAAPVSSPDCFSAGMLTALRDTKPWVRFLSILGMVGCGLMVFAGLGVLVASLVVPGSDNALMAVAGAFYLVFGLVFLLPPLQMHRYAKSIADAVLAPGAQKVEDALERQRVLWKTVGILMLVVTGIYVLAIIGVVVAGAVAAFSRL
jgi:hypothetical protein